MPNTPQPSVTPLEGKTSIDEKMIFEPTRLSYESADDIAEKIAARVRMAVKDQIVVIAGTSLLVDFANLQAVYLTLENLSRDYDSVSVYADNMAKRRAKPRFAGESYGTPTNVLSGAAGGIISPVSAVLSATLGLVSLFRQDVEYHGVLTAIDGLAFELALAARVKKGLAKEVFIPDLMVVPLVDAREGSLRKRLESVQGSKTKAWASIGPYIAELVQLEAELDKATKDKEQGVIDRLNPQVSNLRRDLDPLVAPLSRADQRFDDIQNQWGQTDQTTGLSILARLLRAEAIHSLSPQYLHAAIVSSGGHHRITRSLFRTMFVGDGLSLAGGAIARWALLEKDGSVVQGGIFTARRTSGASWTFHELVQEPSG